MPAQSKPVLFYDGDCGFCRQWIYRWRFVTGTRVRYKPFPKSKSPTEAVQLNAPDGISYHGAEAVFRTLAYVPGSGGWLGCYRKVPGFAAASEAIYHLVARHRVLFSLLTRWILGNHTRPATYVLTRKFFFRLLGASYLAAFWSLGTQIKGLIGANGILPAKNLIEAVGSHMGLERYLFFPSLAWLNCSDGFLQILCIVGSALSIWTMISRTRPWVLFTLWVLYLSLTTVGGDFMGFQWESLLLETGFLSIFFAASRGTGFLWLLRFLLFRLMFSSGVVKLASGDPSWHGLTALLFHYETQPLPSWIGWFAHQLPAWFQRFSVIVMFIIEIVLPFLIFSPRRSRLVAFFGIVGLQVCILLTGSYCFFNLLTLALCVLLVEDADLYFFLRRFWLRIKTKREIVSLSNRTRKWVEVIVFTIMLLLGTEQLSKFVIMRPQLPDSLQYLNDIAQSFRLVSGYGLFAVMTTTRNEIIIEGSNDRRTWVPYEFEWKPGDLTRRPRFVAPHQPRLDWQMWFAALSDYESNPWFKNFLVRLLEGTPEVTALLAVNPFPKTPPRFIRALVYEYHFTDFSTLWKTGEWWRRDLKGDYTPVLNLK